MSKEYKHSLSNYPRTPGAKLLAAMNQILNKPEP
jgi:hypothetical protein